MILKLCKVVSYVVLFLHYPFGIFSPIGQAHPHDVNAGSEVGDVDCCLMRRFGKRLYEAAVDGIDFDGLTCDIVG